VLAQALELAGQLQRALGTRAVIDQALGILMSRTGEGADEAFATLTTLSQRENRKLAVVAQRLVDDAVRRARARHARA
jgi:AmiR/NasT family two-component response regulator